MIDHLRALRLFTRIVDLGSFSRAAEQLGMNRAAATQSIQQLERHLGVRLLARTTRQVTPTVEGAAYYERCVAILADLDEADASAASQRTLATGLLRLNTPLAFGVRHIAPLMPAFNQAHPAITVELGMTDAVVNLVDGRWDLAVRIGSMHDDSLQARRLGNCHMVLCAAPSYLDTHGVPRTVADLAHHNCLGYTLSASQSPSEWRFGPEGQVRQPVRGNLRANSGDALLAAALGGMGVVYEPSFIVGDAIQNGALQALPLDHPPVDLGGIHAVWPANRHPPAKVRAMVDFLVGRWASS